MEKHDRQGFPKNRKKKRKKEKKGSNKTRYTVKVFKLYTNGDWTNSERKSNRISTWIICPVISYILNQHHKRLPEAGEFRSYRQILIILPVNVHANDNNSDSSCIGRTAACTERLHETVRRGQGTILTIARFEFTRQREDVILSTLSLSLSSSPEFPIGSLHRFDQWTMMFRQRFEIGRVLRNLQTRCVATFIRPAGKWLAG